MALVAFEMSALEAAQARTETQLGNQISAYAGVRDGLQGKLAAQQRVLEAARNDLAMARTELAAANKALAAATSMPTNTPEQISKRTAAIAAAQAKVNAANAKIKQAEEKIAAAEAEISTLESEISTADASIELLNSAIRESRAKIERLRAMVREIDGTYMISIRGAAQAIQDYINNINTLMNTFTTNYSNNIDLQYHSAILECAEGSSMAYYYLNYLENEWQLINRRDFEVSMNRSFGYHHKNANEL